MIKVRYSVVCETGQEREDNQDAVFYGANTNAAIFLVADGMGGYEGGSRASGLLKSRVENWWQTYDKARIRPSFRQALKEIRNALEQANEEIYGYTPKGRLSGSTVVILWIEKEMWAVFSCGDSRCYQVEKKGLLRHLHLLTRDDVWENQEQNVWGLTREQIIKHPFYGNLVRAVGVSEGLECTLRSGEWKGSTFFALCSDGIYKCCDEQLFEKELLYASKNGHEESALQNIRENVYRNGAVDNLSLILAKVQAI